jgi:hypothetical protein
MLSEKELSFIQHWESCRLPYSSAVSKLMRGLPAALMFGLPIILFIFSVYLFFPEWYTKISNTSSGTFVTIIIAVLLAVVFLAYFRMHFKWEMNEQLYKELLYKQKKQEAADL